MSSFEDGGQTLPTALRRHLEGGLGTDLGSVRVHSDGTSASAAQSLGARAFTVGTHVAFNRGEYAPDTAAGRHLIAHEVAHVVQQRRNPAARLIQRQDFEVDPMIDKPYIDEYRRENAIPPPEVGGPTDAEIKKSAGYKRWMEPIAAPAKKPKQPKVKKTLDWKNCGDRSKMNADQRKVYTNCVFHVDFVNAMAQAISNIEQVPSVYSKGVAAFYKPLLGMVSATGSMPKTIILGGVKLPISQALTITMPYISLNLKQDLRNRTHGHYTRGSNAITLNEYSFGLASNIDVKLLETTIYHEAIHLFSELITQHNAAQQAAKPKAPLVHPELDVSLVAAHEKRFLKAAEAIWTDYFSQHKSPPANLAAAVKSRAAKTWRKVQDEAIARIEEHVYLRLRGGLAVTRPFLRNLKQSWLRDAGYWVAPAGEETALQKFLFEKKVEKKIAGDVLPVIQDLQATFVRRRPANP